MAEALGWAGEDDPARTVAGHRSPRWMYPDADGTRGRMVGFPRRGDRPGDGEYRDRDLRDESEPAQTVGRSSRSWSVFTGRGSETADGVVPYERDVDEPAPTVDTRGDEWVVNTGRDWKEGGSRDDAQKIPLSEPAPAIDGKGRWRVERAELPVLNPGATDTQPNRRRYSADEPAPTMAFGHDAANWAWERPATTVAGDSRIWPPGHKINADDERRLGEDAARERYGDRAGSEALRLEIPDVLTLQSFRPTYPVQGSRTKQFEQVGNAVPPLLGAHVCAAQLDMEVPCPA